MPGSGLLTACQGSQLWLLFQGGACLLCMVCHVNEGDDFLVPGNPLKVVSFRSYEMPLAGCNHALEVCNPLQVFH